MDTVLKIEIKSPTITLPAVRPIVTPAAGNNRGKASATTSHRKSINLTLLKNLCRQGSPHLHSYDKLVFIQFVFPQIKSSYCLELKYLSSTELFYFLFLSSSGNPLILVNLFLLLSTNSLPSELITK